MNDQRDTVLQLLEVLPGMAMRSRADWPRTVGFVTQSCLTLTGYTAAEIASGFAELIHEEDRQNCWRVVSFAVEQGQDFTVRYRLKTKAGEIKYCQEHGQPAQSTDDGLPAVDSFVADITAQTAAETKIGVYQEQLRSMAAEVALAEERERQRIATELHDQVGQNLALARMRVAELTRAAVPTAVAAQIIEVRGLLEQVISEVRSLTFQISPPLLHTVGLQAALEWLVENFEKRHSLPVELHVFGSVPPLADELKFLLFQATRELLFNIVKHAGANLVAVSLRTHQGQLILRITDNGRGFDMGAQQAGPQGFGLFSIRERLRHLGGIMQVESSPGNGTKVTMMSPLAML